MKQVISTEKAPAAIGPYSQAIEVNGMVYTSGQIPVNPATGEIAGTIEGQGQTGNGEREESSGRSGSHDGPGGKNHSIY